MMKHPVCAVVLLFAAAIGLDLSGATPHGFRQNFLPAVVEADARPLYLDQTQPVEDRVQDLMSRMTLLERQNQLFSVHNVDEQVYSLYKNTSFGAQKLSGFAQTTAAELVAARNQEQAFFVNNSRLHIPLVWHQETLNSCGPQGTLFPLPVSIGSTWNVSLARKLGEVLARECRAFGIDAAYSPEVNLYTDPRNGRLQVCKRPPTFFFVRPTLLPFESSSLEPASISSVGVRGCCHCACGGVNLNWLWTSCRKDFPRTPASPQSSLLPRFWVNKVLVLDPLVLALTWLLTKLQLWASTTLGAHIAFPFKATRVVEVRCSQFVTSNFFALPVMVEVPEASTPVLHISPPTACEISTSHLGARWCNAPASAHSCEATSSGITGQYMHPRSCLNGLNRLVSMIHGAFQIVEILSI